VVLSAILALAALAAAETPEFEAFFKEFQTKRATIHAVAANFSEESHLPEETYTAAGRLFFAQPRRLLRNTLTPDKSVLLLDGRYAYQYEEEVKQCVIHDLKDQPESRILFLGFDGDLEALRKAYDVSLFAAAGDEAREGKYGILVKPYAEDLDTALFVEARFYLRDADYLPWRIQVVHDEHTHTDLRITDYRINPALDPAETQVLLPEGTSVIENDRIVLTVGPGGKRYPESAPPPREPERPAVDVRPLEPPADTQ
jgi:outer membrane lipoprotein-sorting protein